MSDPEIFVHAIGASAAASLPERGFDPALASAKYLKIVRPGPEFAGGIFEVDPLRRAGAEGTDIYLLPGKLGLKYNERVSVSASPATLWAYRASQLNTTNGRLILGTLIAAFTGAWIDGSLAIGKQGTALFAFSAETLGLLGGLSMICKLASAVMAFLLALWFKK